MNLVSGLRACAVAGYILALSGCSGIPEIEEPWEAVAVTGPDMAYRIKTNIFCETVRAVRRVREITINGLNPLPDDYGVQMQVNLTIEESTALNPNGSFTHFMPPEVINLVNVPQSVIFGANGTLSRTTTRVDTSYSYYNIGRIGGKGRNEECFKQQDLSGSSPLLSDLGIYKYLQSAALQSAAFVSSSPAKAGVGKQAELDVFSYQVKFVVVTSAGLSPSLRLAAFAAGTGNQPLLSAGRTRTHDLILTFGPGTDEPASFAQQAHFTNQIVQQPRQ